METNTAPKAKKKGRLRKALRITLVLMVALPLGGYILMNLLMWGWVAEPPEVPENVALLEEVPVREGTRTRLGESWLETGGPLNVLYLTGSPFEMGYANGVLTREMMIRQEEHLLGMVEEKIPNALARFLIKFYVTYHNRDLPRHVDRDHQLEILGVCTGCPDAHPEVGPYYHRILNYHAAHDISHLMIGSPWVVGCTSFGSLRNGKLITGRNFDWEAGDVFDEGRILILCDPDEGIPFVSLSWAGMVGCVSGMNRKGISVTINGIRGRPPENTGTPISLVVRKVLQHASTLKEAEEIIRSAQVFVSELFLVGSRADGKFVVIAKTPARTSVREPESGEGVIACSNHFMCEDLKDDPDNVAFMAEGSSVSRYERLREMLGSSSDALSAERAVEILRDRKLPGGRFPGNGHRGTLNALIATHAVVMDVTDGIFWAGTSPHQLGAFLAFDIEDFKRRPELDVPEDRLLGSGEFQRYQDWKSLIGQAMAEQDVDAALELLDRAEPLNPGFYITAWTRGRVLSRGGRTEEAKAEFQRALDALPASSVERAEIESQLGK